MPKSSPSKQTASASTSKKRKSLQAADVEVEDDRFSSFLDSTNNEQPGEDQPSEAEQDQMDEDEELNSLSTFPKQKPLPSHLLPKHLANSTSASSSSSSSSKKSVKQPGLIYLSRIPPGMGPGKVKHLLSQFGQVGRIYLARADANKGTSPRSRF